MKARFRRHWFECLACQEESSFFCAEFPPKMCGCAHCGVVMRLTGRDAITGKSIYKTVAN